MTTSPATDTAHLDTVAARPAAARAMRRSGRDLRPRTAARALDRALRLLEQRSLSATEVRILLAVLNGEAAASQLAASLDARSADVLHAAERLYATGFLSWRHDRRRDEPVLAITGAGRSTMRPLLA